MGYTTEFQGKLEITPPLKPEQVAYINKLSGTRRMKRKESRCAELPDPIREAVGLPVGKEGEYFVGGLGWAGQDDDLSILDYNGPPLSQPGLWCQWIINDNGKHLEWDGGENFTVMWNG